MKVKKRYQELKKKLLKKNEQDSIFKTNIKKKITSSFCLKQTKGKHQDENFDSLWKIQRSWIQQ